MYIRRKVFSTYIDETGEEKLFSTTEIMSEESYLERLYSESEEQKEFTSIRKAKKVLDSLATNGRSSKGAGKLMDQMQRAKIGSVQKVTSTTKALGASVDPKTGIKKAVPSSVTTTRKKFVGSSKSLPENAADKLGGKINNLRSKKPLEKRNIKQEASDLFKQGGWNSVLKKL